MAGINEMISRAESLNIREALEIAVDQTADQLVRLQRFQLLTGKDSSGGTIGIYRSDRYAFKKFLMNPLPGFRRMDFRLTGDFYKGIFADARENSVVIDSSDEKTGRLLDINPDIFGLSKQNASEYAKQYMGPVATKLIKKKLSG